MVRIVSDEHINNNIIPRLQKLKAASTFEETIPQEASKAAKHSQGIRVGLKKIAPVDERDIAILCETQSALKHIEKTNRKAKRINIAVGSIAPTAPLNYGVAYFNKKMEKKSGAAGSLIKSGLEKADGVNDLPLKKLAFYNDELAGGDLRHQMARHKVVNETLGQSLIDKPKIDESIAKKKMSKDRVKYKLSIVTKSFSKPFSSKSRDALSNLRQNANAGDRSRYAQWMADQSDGLIQKANDKYAKIDTPETKA